jgi:hypothetical protein
MLYDCDGPADTSSQWIRAHLDEIAAFIQTRFPSHDESFKVEKLDIIIRDLSEE